MKKYTYIYFKWQQILACAWLLAIITLLSTNHVFGQTPTALVKWDFDNGKVQCNGAVDNPKKNKQGNPLYTTPLFLQNVYSYCPNFNNGCGLGLLSGCHNNTDDFGHAICLSNFYSPGENGCAYDPNDPKWYPDGAANLVIEFTFPAGKSGCLSSFSLNILQSWKGARKFKTQGVGVYRDGVSTPIYSSTANIALTDINLNAITFNFPTDNNNFCSDGSKDVTFRVTFGLVERVPGVSSIIGYDNIVLNGYCPAPPSVTITQNTCGPNGANADGTIKITGAGATDKYQYSVGSTFNSATAIPASPTTIPANGVIVSNLPAVPTAQTYSVRVTSATGTIIGTYPVKLEASTCPPPCPTPTGTILTATKATCTSNVANSDAKIQVSGVSGGTKIGMSLGTTYTGPDYATAPSLVSGTYSFTGLPNPDVNQVYTVRVFADEACYIDHQVTLGNANCDPCASIVAEIISSDSRDPNSTPNNGIKTENDYATAKICPDPRTINLQLSKTVSPNSGGTCPVGTEFTWILTLSNTGTMAATAIQVADLLPAALQQTKPATVSSGTFSAGSGWYLSSLQPGASASLTIVTKATSVGTFTNCAQVMTAFPLNDPNSTPGNSVTTEDDYACATITVTGSSLPTVTKGFSPNITTPNTPVRLTLNLVNNELVPVTLTSDFVDNFPPQLVIAAIPSLHTSLTNVTAAAGGTSITVPSGTVLRPGNNLIQLEVVAPVVGDYCNTIAAGALKTTSCDNPSGAEACLEVAIDRELAPVISKAISPLVIQRGQSATLVLTIENRNAVNMTVNQDFVDYLPEGLVANGAVTASCAGVSIQNGGTELVMAAGTVIAPGTCTISVPVTSTLVGDYCNRIPMNVLITTVGTNNNLGNRDISEACVTVTDNSCTAISSLSITKNPATGLVLPGSVLSVTATGTGLSTSTLYGWKASGGIFSTQAVSSTWTAPTTAGVYTLTVTADNTLTGFGSCTATATASITIADACVLNITVTPGTCTSATNQYSLSGTVSIANAAAGILTITDGSKSTTVAVTASTTSVAYSLSGLTSGTGSHTVAVSLPGCSSAVVTYDAPASCTNVDPTTGCPGNLLSNGSLENGTFNAFTTSNANINGTLATYGGSQSIFLSADPAGNTLPDKPITGFQANTGYWVDASTNGGTGAKDANRLFVIPANTGANKCVFPNTALGFAYQTENCYKLGFWVAQFDPAAPNSPSLTSIFNFEYEDSFGTSSPGTVSNFSVAPTATSNTGSFRTVSWTLPASTNVKTITGATYTGGSGQVVDWKTLNWQYITLDFTPSVTSDRLHIYLSSTNTNNGVAIDGICATPCATTASCSLVATATPGICATATNQYSVTGVVSLTNNASGGVATITDGAKSTTLTIAASATSVAYSLTGLTSGTGSHTVTVSLVGCGSAVVTYDAPTSCTVAASIVVLSATVCYGSSATLVASGCNGTVSWSNGSTGNTLVTPALTASTNYTATCTTSTGSTTFAVGTATVLPQPILSLQASSTLVTVGTPVSLSAIGCVGTLSWSTNQSGNTISVTPTNPTNTYSATCTTGPGCTTIASITVNTAPSASLVVISATVCYGSSATLVASGCNGTVSWSNNTTGASLVTPALTASTNYTATCTTSTGSTTFAVGTATVMPQPILSLQASSTLVTVGTPVSLSAIGCVGTLIWSTNQSGSTISVTPTNPTNTYSATCTTGPGCTTIASVTVNTAPSANLVVLSATVCYGSSATLVASGCNGTVSWSNGSTGNTLVTPALTASTNYTATCTTSTGSTTSAVGTATVMPQPVLSLQASSTLVTVGTPVSLSAIGCVGTLSWSTNQSGSTISVTPTNPTNTYSATCTTGPGCTTIASVTVNTAPSASLVVISATVCYGSSATLVASGCNGTVSWSNNTTGASLVTPALTASTNYTATCTTSTGSTTTAMGTATVLPQPILSLQASSTLVTVGTPVSLSAIGCVGTLSWSTNQSGSTISVTPSNPTNIYSATCTTGPGCTTIASITVNTAPSASLIVISATVCYGSSATLVASGCNGTVSWSNNTTGASLVTPALTASTNYTATCTTSTGSTTFAVGTATVMPQPIVSLSAIRSGNSLTLTATGCVGSLQWSTGATTTVLAVNVTATTLFSVTCTTGLNCKATAQKQIGFVPVVLDVVTSSAKICAGQSVSIIAVNCGANLLWSTGATTESILVSPSVTTSYSVTCSDDFNSVTGSTSVTVSQLPVLNLSISSSTLLTGQSVTLVASGCQSGTLNWSTGSSLSTIVVNPITTTTYSATCSTGLACSGTATITATVMSTPKLDLTKLVSKSKAQLGEVISYTLLLTNTGNGPATNVVVRDSISSTVLILPGSVLTSTGTFSISSPVNVWTIASLPAGATATLAFSGSLTAAGIHYNTATIPGDTNTVCTTVPIKVCQGSDFAFQLNAPTQYSNYQWYRNGTAIPLATGSSYTATQVGDYTVQRINGQCPGGTCCPVIIEADSVALFTVTPKTPTCVGGQPQNDGSLIVTGLGVITGQFQYAITEGTSFTLSNPTVATVPANGILTTSLVGDRTYTVRIINNLGCYRDVTVQLITNCQCPPQVCVPIKIRRTKTR